MDISPGIKMYFKRFEDFFNPQGAEFSVLFFHHSIA